MKFMKHIMKYTSKAGRTCPAVGNSTCEGMTLIEVLLYTAIAGSVFIAIGVVFSMVIQAREYDQTSAEVNAVGNRIVDVITREIRNASSVTTPLPGEVAELLALESQDPGSGSVSFSISDLTMRVSEATSSNVPLSSGRVEVENFVVTGMEGVDGEVVTFSFTVTHINPDNRSEYSYTRSFQGSAATRSNLNSSL